MTSQGVWIAIAIGVFFAGLGIGYGIFVNSQMNTFGHMGPGGFGMMSGPQMQQMMNDPQTMNQWNQAMMNNPQAMNQWTNTMMQNQQFMQGMMMNPEFQQNWMGHGLATAQTGIT